MRELTLQVLQTVNRLVDFGTATRFLICPQFSSQAIKEVSSSSCPQLNLTGP